MPVSGRSVTHFGQQTISDGILCSFPKVASADFTEVQLTREVDCAILTIAHAAAGFRRVPKATTTGQAQYLAKVVYTGSNPACCFPNFPSRTRPHMSGIFFFAFKRVISTDFELKNNSLKSINSREISRYDRQPDVSFLFLLGNPTNLKSGLRTVG